MLTNSYFHKIFLPLFIVILESSWPTAMGQSIICIGHCNAPCSCTQNQTYQCADGTCVPLTKYRNGVIDCKDKSDEDIECCNGYFKCDTMKNGIGKCLPISSIDDGTVQCMDGSDETATNDKTCSILTALAYENSKTVSDYMYKCRTHKQGSKNPKCIKAAWILDGKYDCPQADDEDQSLFDRCKIGSSPCDTNADCSSRNGTITCTCKPGFIAGAGNCTRTNSGLNGTM